MHISRISPITVGLLVLSIVVFGGAALLLTRPRHHGATPGAEPSVTGDPDDRAREHAALGTRNHLATPPPMTARPAETGAVAVPDLPSPPPVDGGHAPVDDKVAVKNRQLLVAEHNLQLIVQADEHAFDTLKMPDATRVALRRIDEEYGRRARADLSAAADQVTIDQQIGIGIARTDQAERDRRAAIKSLLGPEGATDFATAEYAEARRLRIRYRKQWADELDTTAPWPDGVPRGAH